MNDGPCVGGFTLQHWESTDNKVKKNDDNAKLFNITQQLVFPAKKGMNNSITCNKDTGPNFGISELNAWQQPFN